MKKCFCDGCGKELDYENMNYVSFMIDDFGDKDQAVEAWDFCQDCAANIKHNIVQNIMKIQTKQ